MLRDRAQRQELPRRPRRHLRTVIAHGEQDRAGLVVHIDRHDAIRAGLHAGQQPLTVERVSEHDLDLGGGLLARHDVRQPLA